MAQRNRQTVQKTFSWRLGSSAVLVYVTGAWLQVGWPRAVFSTGWRQVKLPSMQIKEHAFMFWKSKNKVS